MYIVGGWFPTIWHRKQLIMLRNIMNGRYEFVSPEWDEISDAAKDMVREDDTKNISLSLCFIMTVSIFVSDKKVASC